MYAKNKYKFVLQTSEGIKVALMHAVSLNKAYEKVMRIRGFIRVEYIYEV